MKRTSRSLLMGLALAATFAARPAFSQRMGANLPTVEELQADYDAQKYTDVIRKSAQLLQIRPGSNVNANANANAGADPSADADKAKVLRLKADSHLALKQFGPAGDAYLAAAKLEADPKVLAMDTSMGTLVKRSPGGNYTPRTAGTVTTRPSAGGSGATGAASGSAASGSGASSSAGASGSAGTAGSTGTGMAARGKPINIVDPVTRKDALLALFEDEYHLTEPKIEQFSRQQSLPPLLTGIKQVADLREFEVAATGADKQTGKLVGNLSGQAVKIMSAAIKQMTLNVDNISKAANKTSEMQQSLPGQVDLQLVVVKAGLTSTDQSALNDVIQTCTTISEVCSELSESLGTSGAPLAGVGKEADTLSQHANTVLTTDYGGTAMPADVTSTTLRPGTVYRNTGTGNVPRTTIRNTPGN